MEYDFSLYDHCSTEYLRLEEERQHKAEESARRWEAITRLAASVQQV
jgi:hypothetical protein